MATLDSIVTVTITTEGVRVTQAGFGTPLIMTMKVPAAFTERYREYAATSEMVTDGFATTDPAYLAATAVFSQSPRPETVIVGRQAGTPSAQTVKLTPVAPVANSTAYTVTINGTDFTYTSDATATVAEITAGLEALINAGGEPVTATDNITDLDLVSDVAVDLFTLEVNRKLLERKDNSADDGIVADITAVTDENDDWYALLLTRESEAEILAAAAHIETLKKTMFYATADDEVYDSGVTTDVMSDMETAAYTRSMGIYHTKPHQYAAAAWAGNMLPRDPGSATPKFKTLAGVDSYLLTTTETSSLEAKNGNHYQEVAGVNITQQGVVASGEFYDVIRFIDFLTARMQEGVFERLAALAKIPFTDQGIAVVEAEVRAALQLGIGTGGLAADPAPAVSVPRAADVSTANKANRVLPDVTFEATLAGAIHSTQISGVVSV